MCYQLRVDFSRFSYILFNNSTNELSDISLKGQKILILKNQEEKHFIIHFYCRRTKCCPCEKPAIPSLLHHTTPGKSTLPNPLGPRLHWKLVLKTLNKRLEF